MLDRVAGWEESEARIEVGQGQFRTVLCGGGPVFWVMEFVRATKARPPVPHAAISSNKQAISIDRNVPGRKAWRNME